MADLFHIRGTDLIITETGGLEIATGNDVGTQRVLRRLATNAGDYIFALDYGAGLPGRVGGVDTPADLKAVILQQMTLEPMVSSNPAPVVNVQDIGLGERQISITYVSTSTGDTVTLEI
ncbi:phage tail protein [Acetobacter fallax]|uniref:Phage tail protein n=1 Tax=Acetobacter fallax TaxID=1737473 RepID=A0ABX0K6J6_9PROT|nr:phage tail protein [Acetobacter fallax]NHO32020.1 phage tail protein [Acetobacter fallax]NHO35464.1 phage tail protein [Acetobacter fallax]